MGFRFPRADKESASMLSAHAYSFRQKSRLAISLSWIAGYTNVITLIVSTDRLRGGA
jgi:hypothetical protein